MTQCPLFAICSDTPVGQQEVKQRDNQRIFEEMRTRVGNLRSEQDQASIRKAEAAIEYAVCLPRDRA